MTPSRIAILIPCYNEEATVAETIEDYRARFPLAQIVVCDNASADATAAKARASGATVIFEPRQGKGCAIRTLFASVDADFFVLTDGDTTYRADDALRLLPLVTEKGVDMALGDRLSGGAYAKGKARAFHLQGNRLIALLISTLFRKSLRDPMTGLRVMGRRFVKTVPLISAGFEIEVEMACHAFDKGFVVSEAPISYFDRPQGSLSKLKTFSDGARAIWTSLRFALYFRPLLVTLLFVGISLLGAVVLGIGPVLEYVRFQYVYKVPSLVVATGLAVVAIFAFFAGVILEVLRYARMENFLILTNEFHSRQSR